MEDMIRIEGDEEASSEKEGEESESQEPVTEDQMQDAFAKKFLKEIGKVGPYSKQIMNYSYPPLLYQRGDDSEDDDEEDMGEEMEGMEGLFDD